LFLIYINDLFALPFAKLQPLCFADDTVLSYPIKSSNDISDFIDELSSVMHWFNNSHLILNSSKCYMLNFHLNKTVIENLEYLSINKTNFYLKENIKYLGVMYDNKLKFTYHFNYIFPKLLYFNKLLNKLNNIIPKKLSSLLYLQFVLPIIEYCNLIYIPFNKKCLKKLKTINNRILKYTSLEPLLFDIDMRLMLSAIKIIHKIFNKQVPLYLNKFNSSTYNTRNIFIQSHHLHSSKLKLSHRYWGVTLSNFLKSNNINLHSNLPAILKNFDYSKNLFYFIEN
jgi:hypothetical protein